MDEYGRKHISNLNSLAYLFFSLTSLQYSFINTNFEFSGVGSTLFVCLEATVCFICLAMKKFDLRTFIKVSLIFFICLMNYAETHETVFVIELLAAIMYSMIDAKILFKLIFYERLILLIFIILCSCVGILPFNVVSVFKGGSTPNTVVGYAFGYNHPNQFASSICFLILIYLCYKSGRIKVHNILFVAIAGLLAYYFSKSRTLLVVTIFVLFMIVLLKSKVTSDAVIATLNVIAPWILPVLSIASVLLPLSMATATGKFREYLWAVNGLIGSRFTHAARVFSTYQVPLFGGINQFIELQNLYGYSVVDSGYVNILYDFGIIGFTIFIFLYIIAIRKLLKRQEYVYVIVTIATFLWGITENILRSFGLNFTVVFWGLILICEIQQQNRRQIKVRL